MKSRIMVAIAFFATFLSGCATTQRIQSDVTVFHEWPAQLEGRTFTIERTEAQENNLERRAYENMLRDELRRLNFSEAESAKSAHIRAVFDYGISARDVRVVQPVVDPFWYDRPFYRPFHHPYWHGFYRPFHDPFWHGMPVTGYQETSYTVYKRTLNVALYRVADGKKLYDVTVISEGTNGSLAAVMPYMMRSAFDDFPGQSGASRRIVMDMKE
jgi:hypothetical protein